MSELASSSQLRMQHSSGAGLEGYVSATRELRQACADLVPGQMIAVSDFTLMDSMAALQIMDPRMDSGIFPIPDHLIAKCDRLPDGARIPSFDPQPELSAVDICWIMDRLLACEIEWHKGASLSQTIYTCRYVHHLASLSANACYAAGRESNWLVLRVLQPFVIAVLKSVGLVWDEVAKGNVADGEDFNCDKAGVSLLEQTNPDEALDWLQDGIFYVQALQAEDVAAQDTLSNEQAEALLTRLRVRKNLLLAISTFSKVDPSLKLGRGSDPTQILLELPTVVQQAQSQLDALDERLLADYQQGGCLKGPSFSNAPSDKAISAFDANYCRRPFFNEEMNAPSAPPPPLPLLLKEPSEVIASYRAMLTNLSEAQQLVCGNIGWAHWKSFFESKAIDFQRHTALPYVRSLWQSLICSEGIIALRYTLDFIADDFLEHEAGIEHGSLPRLAQSSQLAGDSSSASLAKRIKWFSERLAGQLVNHLCSLAQNRSRGRRSLAASYPTLLELSSEAAAIDASLAETSESHAREGHRLASAVQKLTLDTMLHIVFSGFELDLYRIEECAVVYWIAHRIAEEKIVLLESMQAVKTSQDFGNSGASLDAQLAFVKAIAAASSAMCLLFESRSLVRHTWAPWRPAIEDQDVLGSAPKSKDEKSLFDDIDRVAFCRRFKWLRGKGRPELMQTLDNLWHDYQAERRSLKASSRRERLDRSSGCLGEAIDHLRQMREGHIDKHIPALILSLQDIQIACDSDQDQSTPFCLLPLTFQHTISHPWFPVLLHTQY